MDVKRRRAHFIASLDSLRGSSVKIGTIQRRLAWPLRKDDTHKSRSVNNSLTTAWLRQPLPFVPGQAVCDRCVAWRAPPATELTHARNKRPRTPSTNRALRRITSEVGRDPVHSTRYGRQRLCWELRDSRVCVLAQARAKSWQHPEGLRAVPHPSTNNAHAGDCANASGAKSWQPLRSSRAVPHPSTNRALRRLTSEVGRDPVHSTRYGRQRVRMRGAGLRQGSKLGRAEWRSG